MSRFPELFEEAIDEVVIGEAFLVEELAEHIARHIVGRQRRGRAEVRIAARYPLERRTPVTGLATQEMISLDRHRRRVGVAACGASSASRPPASTRAPARRVSCAARRPSGCSRPGFDEVDVERILQLVPIATHNQRGRGTLYVGSDHPVNAEQLASIVEGSMSSPIYELLKRPDELFVVEHAHLQPRFVEDSVRIALQSTLERYAELEGRGLPARAPAQLRDDPFARGARRAVRDGRRAPRRAPRPRSRRRGTPSYASGCGCVRLSGRRKLKRFSVPARRRAMFGAVEQEDRDGRAGGEHDHRPRLAEQHRDDRQRDRRGDRRERRVAEERGRRRSRRRRPTAPTSGRDPEERPAARRHHLPAAPQAEEQRPPVPEHRRGAGEHAARSDTHELATSAGTKPFAVSSNTTGSPSRQP